jgi:hypothetical protein
MAEQPKRIRDLKKIDKDFPICREQILKESWIPHVLCDKNGAYWDELTAKDVTGRLVGPLPDPVESR